MQAEHLGDVLQRHVVDEVVVPAQDDEDDDLRMRFFTPTVLSHAIFKSAYLFFVSCDRSFLKGSLISVLIPEF